jgi:hypothetical protein
VRTRLPVLLAILGLLFGAVSCGGGEDQEEQQEQEGYEQEDQEDVG